MDYSEKREHLLQLSDRLMNADWLLWCLGWLRITIPIMVVPVLWRRSTMAQEVSDFV